MALITHTNPVLISTRKDGLKEYRYELNGLVNAICTTFCKTLPQAILKAKEDISKYLKRSEKMCELSQINKRNLSFKAFESGWKGVEWDDLRKNWKITTYVPETQKLHYIGVRSKLSKATFIKRQSNVKLGLPKYFDCKKESK